MTRRTGIVLTLLLGVLAALLGAAAQGSAGAVERDVTTAVVEQPRYTLTNGKVLSVERSAQLDREWAKAQSRTSQAQAPSWFNLSPPLSDWVDITVCRKEDASSPKARMQIVIYNISNYAGNGRPMKLRGYGEFYYGDTRRTPPSPGSWTTSPGLINSSKQGGVTWWQGYSLGTGGWNSTRAMGCRVNHAQGSYTN